MIYLTSKLRSLIFYVVDGFKGFPIKGHQRELLKYQEKEDVHSLVAHSNEKIVKLLTHAKSHVPYYMNQIGLETLSDFPVITKPSIQENFNDFISSLHRNQKKIKVSTSGSTGIPFFLYWGQGKKKRNSADTLFYLKKAGYNLGEKLVFIGATSSIGKEQTLKRKLENFQYFNLKSVNEAQIKVILENLANSSFPQTIVGYASNLEYIAQYIEQNKLEQFRSIKIKAVVAIAEALSDYTKHFFMSYFGVRILSRYSSQEVGILAQQSLHEKGNDFEVNWASYHMEILEIDSDEPAEEGEIGRIVVTDLYNYMMPIIRYDTGDLSYFLDKVTVHNPFPKLTKIQGRRIDAVYDTKGKQVSSLFIDNQFYPYFDRIKQFQFIQSGLKEYLIKLNMFSGICDFEEELIAEVRSNFGDDAKVSIELVEEIPVLASGKRKKVKNDYHK